MNDPDWSLIRTFLEVAESGSFSAAGRSLSISQPTVGRHVRELESQVGLELFQRGSRGQTLSLDGMALLERAREMKAAAARLGLVARGREDEMDGVVRITASTVVAHFILPPMIAAMRQAHPGIAIELVPTDAPENLLFREADIAVRMFRPTQLDIVTRHVADQALGLYATPDYLDRKGRPQTIAEFKRHDVVGFDRSELIIRTMRDLGLDVDRDFFPVRCDDQAAFWHLVIAGCGIGGMQCIIADREHRVERVLPDFPLPDLPVWLAAPQAIRHTARIRAVWDHLADGFSAPLP